MWVKVKRIEINIIYLSGFKTVRTALFNNRNFANGFLWYKKGSNVINMKVNAYVPSRYSSKKYKICQ